MKKSLVLAALLAAVPCAFAAPEAGGSVTPAFSHVLPNVAGKSLTGLVVRYKPGEVTAPHRHGSAFVVGYVLSGAIRSGVSGGTARIYHAGESWSEDPGAHHTVSANASTTEPASLLAIFVADSAAPAPVVMDKP